MTKIPCIDCVTLAMCKSLVSSRYLILIEAEKAHIKSGSPWDEVIEVEWLINWWETLIFEPLTRKCTIASVYLANDNKVGLEDDRTAALFSYLHSEAYRKYNTLKEYRKTLLFNV